MVLPRPAHEPAAAYRCVPMPVPPVDVGQRGALRIFAEAPVAGASVQEPQAGPEEIRHEGIALHRGPDLVPAVTVVEARPREVVHEAVLAPVVVRSDPPVVECVHGLFHFGEALRFPGVEWAKSPRPVDPLGSDVRIHAMAVELRQAWKRGLCAL